MNNSYGTYNKITLAYLVAGAKMHLGIKDSSEDDLYLEDLANMGVKELRNLGVIIPAVAKLPIVDFKSKLPDGFIKFAHAYPIVYCDQYGGSILNHPTAPQFLNNPFYTNSPFTPSNWTWGGTVTLVDGYLYFSTNITAQFCKVAYNSTSLDNDGNILIPAIAERTLIAFMCWKYSQTYSNKIPSEIRREREDEWKRGKQQLKGINAGNQGYDWPITALEMNTLI